MKKRQRHKKFKEGGKKGGDKTLEMHGKKHFEDIGKKGALKRWSKVGVKEIKEGEEGYEPVDNLENAV